MYIAAEYVHCNTLHHPATLRNTLQYPAIETHLFTLTQTHMALKQVQEYLKMQIVFFELLKDKRKTQIHTQKHLKMRMVFFEPLKKSYMC